MPEIRDINHKIRNIAGVGTTEKNQDKTKKLGWVSFCKGTGFQIVSD